MSDYHVTVFGGTGFLGRNVVYRLLKKGYQVRVAVRNPRPDLFRKSVNVVEQVRGDVRDKQSVSDAIKGADGVVNAVGLYVERQAATFNAVHIEGARHIAEQTVASGAKLVHISGIGADPESPSAYIRARAGGKQRVREAAPDAVILNPSVLFGRNDAFLRTLSGLIRFLPVIPLFGDGNTRLQPVYVKDVAKAVEHVFSDPEVARNTYDLGGPGIYTYKGVLEVVAKHMKRKRVLLPVPFMIWDIQAAIVSALPNPPITRDQITLMRRDNLVEPDAATFSNLRIEPRALEDLLPFCLPTKPV